MTPLPIQEHEDRLSWALAQIARFENATNYFLAGDPYCLAWTTMDEPDGRVLVDVRFKVNSPQVWPRVRFLAGDVINNLRATLDGLVWACGQRHGADEHLAMVFYTKHAEYSKYSKTRGLDRLPQPVQQWIEGQQTFRQPQGKPTRLAVLHELWNKSKHRAPVLMGSSVDAFRLRDTGPDPIDVSSMRIGKYNDGDHVVSIRITRATVSVFEPMFKIDLALAEGPECAASAAFRWYHDHLRDVVLPLFAPHL